MCPLSATFQFFIVIVTFLLLCHHALAQLSCNKVQLTLPENVTLTMGESKYFDFNITGHEPGGKNLDFILDGYDRNVMRPLDVRVDSERPNGSFGLHGNFLGKTEVELSVYEKPNPEKLCTSKTKVFVLRKKRVIDTIFTFSVIVLVSIIYINFGCAVNWGELKTSLKRPIGPLIGVIGQFIVMPILSFGLGQILFPDNPEMQLGFFFAGVSPGGGASNVWVAVLDGNIDLSITMTAISTIGALAMIPFWVFTLGRVIFAKGNLGVPYSKLSTYVIALVVPLLIGYIMQRFFKKVSNFFVRILKAFSGILILFIIIFAIVTNLYIFKIFSWQIVVAGLGLPWLGYLIAYGLAKLGKRSDKDSLTIAVETGIQNTGIAIFLLRVALPQPEADLTTVAPVSVAIMTPLPLICVWIYLKVKARFWQKQEKVDLLNGNTNLMEVDYDNNSQVTSKNDAKDISTISYIAQ